MSKPGETRVDSATDAPEQAPASLTREMVLGVRDACLCLHAQRAARALARRFDRALAPAGMTNGQFSLMMVLSGPEPKPPARVAAFLAMDRTSLTAMVKPLERRGWVEVRVSDSDRRERRLILTEVGRAALVRALPIWRREHAVVDATVAEPQALREGLNALAYHGQPAGPARDDSGAAVPAGGSNGAAPEVGSDRA